MAVFSLPRLTHSPAIANWRGHWRSRPPPQAFELEIPSLCWAWRWFVMTASVESLPCGAEDLHSPCSLSVIAQSSKSRHAEAQQEPPERSGERRLLRWAEARNQ